MKHTPNDTSKRMLEKPDPITSSARDPIDRWLDVFVRLLRVPKQDAQRIRDELEDHLRARVDDLMVTGQSEPEAVRLAVAELGETAELARQFQTAAKPHRRRTMLAASTLVSAGLMVSAVMLTQQAVPPSTVQNAGASEESPRDAAAVQSETKRVDLDTILFAEDLVARQGEELVRLEDAIALIRATAPQDVIVNYAGITGPQVPGETHADRCDPHARSRAIAARRA
ncbi:MAG: permease prefix domain 1-containing protein, partial [Planctomycetota bacterium]